MNWMTSGRKRVQRSQKGRELRAKHFAKIAADRTRASVSQPARAARSSSTRQSTDVSRLKSRWTQQPLAENAGRGLAPADSTPLPLDTRTLRPGTTPEGSPFQPGTLELDVTPPFGATRPYRGSGSTGGDDDRAERGVGVVVSDRANLTDGGGDPLETPFEQPQSRQQSFHHLMPALPPAASDARFPQRRTRGALERRQLVFGGNACAVEQHELELKEDYEGHVLGGEAAGVGSSPGAVEEEKRLVVLEAGVAGEAAVADFAETTGILGRSGRLSDQWGSSMRFFNAGVEVALDGSPVPDNEFSSPPPPSRSEGSGAGRLMFPANVRDTAGAPSGVLSSEDMRGLAKFSVGGGKSLGGGDRALVASSESWEENLPRDTDTTE
ncbi:unnamed protein product [Hapterophycus canaliculatus]